MNSLMTLNFAEFTAWFGHWWWPFVRVTAAFWILPVFGDSRVSTPVRILFSALICLLIAPLMPSMPAVDPLSVSGIVLTVEQALFGILFGLCIQLLFMVLTLAGQIISLQIGLSMAVMNDPTNGDSAPILSQIMLIFCTLLFLALNGHLVTLDLLIKSFRLWPVGHSLYQLDLSMIIKMFGWSILAALALTLPAVVAMLMVNLTFGVMNRAAPSLNIISLGFPMTLLLGLIAFSLSISGVPARYLSLVDEAFTMLRGVISP